MNDQPKTLETVLEDIVRRVVREELAANGNGKAPPPGLMSAKQAAKFYSLPESWILESARSGQLPSFKLGHYRRFKPKDLEDYVARHRTGKSS